MNQKPLCELTHIEALALVVELTDKVQHWQANHRHLAWRCAMLSQRDDLPVDRIPAYRELERLQKENAQLRVVTDFVYREVYEPKEPLSFGMRGPKMFFSVGVQSFALDYEPDPAGDDFAFMSAMLTKAIARAAPPSATNEIKEGNGT